MENEKVIEKVVQLLKSNTYFSKITDYLTSENIPESEFDSVIKKARSIIFDEKIPGISKRNKITFAVYFGLTIVIFYFFYFFLPEKIESESTILSILGAFFTSLLGLITFAHYNSWKSELIKIQQRPNINYSLLGVLIIIPFFILYFIISFRFENVANELLKKNQIEVTGKIVSGGETELINRRGSIKISNVSVEFKTTEGETIIATEDISHYEFQNFYLDQEINLIYSKTNPQNIGLLNNTSNITKFKDTKEKDILPSDLIILINIKSEDYEKELNKISYGWKYNQEQDLWLNERKNVAVGFKENSIIYVSENPILIKYNLEKDGFKSDKKEKKDIISQMNATGTYKKDDYIANIEPIRNENGEVPLIITTISKIQ